VVETSGFLRLAGGWFWFVLRKSIAGWLLVADLIWPVADKPNKQAPCLGKKNKLSHKLSGVI
jgi:hypothetical protein